MGTPEFGAVVLDKLCQSEFRPILVVTAPDKPVGRKQIITPPPVKLLAQKYGIPILQPEILTNYKLQITNYKPDLIVVAAYGKILPKEILEIPKYGCLNVHPSFLPKYRGPSPIQYTILNGDEETGVTIIKMTEKVDSGPIIASEKLKVESEKPTYEELYNKLAEKGANLLLEVIPKRIKGEIEPLPQNEAKATYTKILKREDGKIDWQKPAEHIERQIRAFSPEPGVFTGFKIKDLRFKILKILKAGVLEQTKNGPFGEPGKTFLAPDDKIAVNCGQGLLVIKKLQLAGGRPLIAADFLRGHRHIIGQTLF